MHDPLHLLSKIIHAEHEASSDAELAVCSLFRPMAERKTIEYQSTLDRRTPDAVRSIQEHAGYTGSD